MKKQILKTKRKLMVHRDFGQENEKEFDNFNVAIKSVKTRKIKNETENKNESKSSGKERTVSVLKGEEIITLSTEKLSHFQKFIDCFNCLFYIKDNNRHYLINPGEVELFFEESDYHILYDLDFSNLFDETIFRQIHSLPKRKYMKTIGEFCIFYQWYFDTDEHKFFYTALWSADRILKFNRLNDKNYGEYMNPKFDKCSNSRITKFYGPFGTGKSTLVYAFFKSISYVSIPDNSETEKNSDKKTNKINQNLEELISKKKYKITIKKNKNILNNYIEVDSQLSFNDVREKSNNDSKIENTIELEEKEESKKKK